MNFDATLLVLVWETSTSEKASSIEIAYSEQTSLSARLIANNDKE